MSMRWTESEELADARPGEKAAIEKLDGFLGARNRSDLLDPRRIKAATGLAIGQVEDLLAEYEDRKVLRGEDMVECPTCEQLSPLEEVAAAREEGEQYPCVRSDQDLALLEDLAELRVYQLLSEPPPLID
jgi:hypothetical protein